MKLLNLILIYLILIFSLIFLQGISWDSWVINTIFINVLISYNILSDFIHQYVSLRKILSVAISFRFSSLVNSTVLFIKTLKLTKCISNQMLQKTDYIVFTELGSVCKTMLRACYKELIREAESGIIKNPKSFSRFLTHKGTKHEIPVNVAFKNTTKCNVKLLNVTVIT